MFHTHVPPTSANEQFVAFLVSHLFFLLLMKVFRAINFPMDIFYLHLKSLVYCHVVIFFDEIIISMVYSLTHVFFNIVLLSLHLFESFLQIHLLIIIFIAYWSVKDVFSISAFLCWFMRLLCHSIWSTFVKVPQTSEK